MEGGIKIKTKSQSSKAFKRAEKNNSRHCSKKNTNILLFYAGLIMF